MIYYITGGARSGKTRYAQDLALSLSPYPLYVATARPRDENFQERINWHQADLDAQWTTMETDKYPSAGLGGCGPTTPENRHVVIYPSDARCLHGQSRRVG